MNKEPSSRPWAIAKRKWDDVLSGLSQTRRQLNCQSRSAWFRGVSDHKFELSPSLYRGSNTTGALLESVLGSSRVRNGLGAPDRLRHLLSKERERNRISVQTFNYVKTCLDELEGLEVDKQHKSMCNFLGSIPSELDAFHEFYNRSRLGGETSWETLAIMRHSGVPTRLLDWTESAFIAMYFALQDYTAELVGFWRSVGRWDGDFPPFYVPQDLPEPAIWIMNPFHLAEASGLIGVIPYPGLPPLPDYYDSLLVKRDWPFKCPVPLHAPRALPRMESQRGHFTVHGYEVSPLEVQFKVSKTNDKLARVEIPKWAAVYGAWHLWQHENFDKFELYRDLDTLGHVVAHRHFPAKSRQGWIEWMCGDGIAVDGGSRISPRPGTKLRFDRKVEIRQQLNNRADFDRWVKFPILYSMPVGARVRVLEVDRRLSPPHWLLRIEPA